MSPTKPRTVPISIVPTSSVCGSAAPSVEVVLPSHGGNTVDGGEGPLATILTNVDKDLRPTPTPLFITPNDSSLQVAFIRKESGTIIRAHRHLHQTRVVDSTQEVILVLRGRIRVDLYLSSGHLETSRELAQGDVIILHAGGHGFVFLEDSEIYEVKQGPYRGQRNDKAYLDNQ